ncbi:MAG: ABC transporter ATP-binding protein [Clostridia bacterium]|nr:ABC transporter ATP-binding protein [Clostridia bacterium]
MEQKNTILKAENLMKTYNGGGTFVNAVNRVSLPFYERDFTAIVGPSGSGKSTLLHLLGGIDLPSGGDVWVYPQSESEKRPVNLYALSRSKLAKFRGRNFGFVFQNYALLPVLTAWENVMTPSIYNNTEFDEDYALNLFSRLGLSDRVHHLPSELSGGEQQRVAVIRAMISRPRILFADEPTGNLDKKNGEEMLKLLFEMRDEHNITVIMVTHDPDAAAMADRVVHMQDGEVVQVI